MRAWKKASGGDFLPVSDVHLCRSLALRMGVDVGTDFFSLFKNAHVRYAALGMKVCVGGGARSYLRTAGEGGAGFWVSVGRWSRGPSHVRLIAGAAAAPRLVFRVAEGLMIVGPLFFEGPGS